MRSALRMILGSVTLLCAATALAQTGNLSKEEVASAVVLDSLSIPTPGEFFAAINKVERPNWTQLHRNTSTEATPSRAKAALTVGTRVADGFIAVEAQDGQGVKNIGKDIIELAKGLGVSQSILSRGNSISDFAENNDWSTLREELENTENEVKLQMSGQKDEDLITLVTVGAWLRGLQAASQVVNDHYSEPYAALLRQPAIVGYLVAKVDALPDRLKNDELVGKVREGLVTIQSTVEPEQVPTPDNVKTLQTTTTTLVDAICGPPAPEQ